MVGIAPSSPPLNMPLQREIFLFTEDVSVEQKCHKEHLYQIRFAFDNGTLLDLFPYCLVPVYFFPSHPALVETPDPVSTGVTGSCLISSPKPTISP